MAKAYIVRVTVPPQPHLQTPLLKNGSTVNLTCYESALKESHEIKQVKHEE